MFPDNNNDEMTEKQLLKKVLEELDEIKRYAAGSYGKVDKEIDEMREMLKRIDKQNVETDRQVDKIEQFERAINEIRQSVRNMERKIK